MLRPTVAVIMLASVIASTGSAWGQAANYPAKPVRVVIPWPPGGTVDTMGRMLAAQMATQSGWTLFIENRAGANSMIGADVVIKSPPDGYTLMYNSASYAINQALYPDRNINLLRDFIPVSNSTTTAGSILTINGSLPVANFRDFIGLAKASAQDGKPIAYGSPGVGNGTHLTTELFGMRAGIKLLHVPHPGVAQMVTSVLQGQIAFIITPGTALGAYIKQGKLRGIAVTGAARIPLVPDAPTLAELGVPGFPIPGSWSGWYAPAKTPMDIVMKVNAEVRKALQAPKIKEVLVATGNEPVGSSPEEFARLITSEIERYAEVVKAANIKAE